MLVISLTWFCIFSLFWYSACRVDGVGQIACLFIAAIFSCLDALGFALQGSDLVGPHDPAVS
jgi:hypothetical protein